jgi:putative tryptophan/tyrosine transport system substrate-binding protein
VASLARPGGNVTGFTLVESSIVGKWLELLKEIAPRVNRLAFLFNPAAAPYAQYYLAVFKAAAPSLGMEAIAAPINKTSEIERVIAEQARDQNGGLFFMPDTFLFVHRVEVTSLAARYALAAVYPYSDYTKVGGLSHMAMTCSIVIGAQRSMLIVSCGARNRASFPSNSRSKSS